VAAVQCAVCARLRTNRSVKPKTSVRTGRGASTSEDEYRECKQNQLIYSNGEPRPVPHVLNCHTINNWQATWNVDIYHRIGRSFHCSSIVLDFQ
jgi:hypothetical protein